MKLKIIYAGLIIAVICGCSGSEKPKKQNTETQKQIENISTLPKVNEFEQLCRNAVQEKIYFFDIIMNDTVKNRIISDYSQRFYDVLSLYMGTSSPMSYENGVYKCSCFNNKDHYIDSQMSFTYDPSVDKLIIKISFEDRYDELMEDVIDKDGNFKLNTEGWDFYVLDNENDFGEVTSRIATAIQCFTYDDVPFMGHYEYEYVIQLLSKFSMIYTNKFGDFSDIQDIRIKDLQKGEVYDIEIMEKMHNEKSYVADDIGGYISIGTTLKLIDIISNTSEYSISLRSTSDKNIVISQNKAIDYIKNAFYKVCFMQDLINWEDKNGIKRESDS